MRYHFTEDANEVYVWDSEEGGIVGSFTAAEIVALMAERDALLSAIHYALRMIDARQVYDKDVKGRLEAAIGQKEAG